MLERHMLRLGVILTAVLIVMLAGCGQKGDLYLPDEDQVSLEVIQDENRA
ncbi:MAG: lipoprotein [Gammaproteobacteria bacterium]